MKNNISKLSTTIISKISTAIALGILLVACDHTSNFQSETVNVEEGIDITENPLEVIQKVLDIGKNSADASENVERDREVSIEPVSFRKLLEYLPEPPQEWTAQKPKGQNNSFGNYSISQVKQTYSYQDKQMTVSIFDWAFNSALYVPFLLTTGFSQESTEGYNKGIKIGDIPGREEYNYATQDGSLNLLIDRRFFVQIDGDNIEETELREWWELIDFPSLAKVNNE